jgi:hypothetical protein
VSDVSCCVSGVSGVEISSSTSIEFINYLIIIKIVCDVLSLSFVCPDMQGRANLIFFIRHRFRITHTLILRSTHIARYRFYQNQLILKGLRFIIYTSRVPAVSLRGNSTNVYIFYQFLLPKIL